jgi:protein-S-isoprenylcysteine O-methyltransferase Ste14
MNWLLVRAVVAFLAFPGMVAFAIPLLAVSPARSAQDYRIWGALPLVAGTVLLLRCVRDFYVAGRGTLAPWSPPRHLVTSGAYGYSRNPMYIAVLLIVIGWAAGFRSTPLGLYGVGLGIAFHLRVVLGEEPWLARTFGPEWDRYRRSVPRWIPLRKRVKSEG